MRPEEMTMAIQTYWSRTAVATIAGATASLFLGGPAASAAANPEPTDQTVAVQFCPRIDNLAKPLRIAGFSSQAAKNYAILTRRDCIDESG
jgi:hypothetical protein